MKNETLVYSKQATFIIDECIYSLYKLDYLGMLTGRLGEQKQIKDSELIEEDFQAMKQLLLGVQSGQTYSNETINQIANIMNTQERSIIDEVTPIQYLLQRTVSYIDFDDLLGDLVHMIQQYLVEQLDYSVHLLYAIVRRIQKKYRSKFEDSNRKDIHRLFRLCRSDCMESQFIPKSESDFRSYIKIEAYRVNGEHQTLQRLIGSELIARLCPLECECHTVVDYYGESSCPNHNNKILCLKECQCKNNFDGSVDRTEDFKEIVAWGLSFYTKKNIFYLLVGEESESSRKFQFIEGSLQKAMNQQGYKGYQLSSALDYICEVNLKNILKNDFTEYDKMQARQLRKALKYDKDETAFKIHTKGKGVICVKNIIRRGEFITKYLGELYTPYRWFEKQDLIKQFKKVDKSMPEFFNIILQRSKLESQDPNGLVVIDPTNLGNFASRFSHSCIPNCYTTTMICDGEYFIGMFALQDIQCGEEMTFDYCSGSTNHSEQHDSQCLCGMINTNHYYLKYYDWRQHLKDWVLVNVRVLMSTIDTVQGTTMTPQWLQVWLTHVTDLVKNISNQEVRDILNQSIKMTEGRIINYFQLLQRHQSDTWQQHPLIKLTKEEVFLQKQIIQKVCDLFLGNETHGGEIHFIHQYIEQLRNQRLSKLFKEYQQIIMEKRGDHDTVLNEIQYFLQYLAMLVNDDSLSQLLNQRAQIRDVIRHNTFPTVCGRPFIKIEFCNFQNYINYDTLDTQVEFTYTSDFLWRVTSDINQDSQLNFTRQLIKRYGVFKNPKHKQHQQFLEREKYFYSPLIGHNAPLRTRNEVLEHIKRQVIQFDTDLCDSIKSINDAPLIKKKMKPTKMEEEEVEEIEDPHIKEEQITPINSRNQCLRLKFQSWLDELRPLPTTVVNQTHFYRQQSQTDFEEWRRRNDYTGYMPWYQQPLKYFTMQTDFEVWRRTNDYTESKPYYYRSFLTYNNFRKI